MPVRKVAVIGGGIGGLTTALALHDRGFAVTVFEQARHLTETGAGLQVAPNAGRVLHHLGLGAALATSGAEAGITTMRHGRTGDVLRIVNHAALRDRHGLPQYRPHRADLQAMLGAVCGNPARTDLCGGTGETQFPTANLVHVLPPSDSLQSGYRLWTSRRLIFQGLEMRHWQMGVFHHLSRFGSTVKVRASPVWGSAVRQSQHCLQWLKRHYLPWLTRRRRPIVLVTAGCVLLYLGLPYGPQVWSAYKSKPEIFTPFFTPIAALLAGLAAFGQWRTARLRHEEQTAADRRRRITESYSKAVSQLASDKVEERLGGIYTLESISKESPDDYWTVMETLTAFVRERSQRNERERTSIDLEVRANTRAYFLWQAAGEPEGQAEKHKAQALEQEKLGEPPATDISAVLTVIKRRDKWNREREKAKTWRLDFRGAVLKQANLWDAHLERAILEDVHLERAILEDAHLERAGLARAHLEGASLGVAHLEGANLWGAYLEGADLRYAHLEGAILRDAHLEGANLWGAYLERADLRYAHLEGANLWDAHLEGASLGGAHLEGAVLQDAHLEMASLGGADLGGVVGLLEQQIANAHGDAETQLPPYITRPAHWPAADTAVPSIVPRGVV